jgi:hypothetical protein
MVLLQPSVASREEEMKNWPGFEFVRWVFFPWVVSTKIRWDWCYLFWVVAGSWWSWTNAHQVLEVLSPKRSPVCQHFVFFTHGYKSRPIVFSALVLDLAQLVTYCDHS